MPRHARVSASPEDAAEAAIHGRLAGGDAPFDSLAEVEAGSVRVGRGQRRAARTRASLLAAALELFAERGIDATRVADITERADVGSGSFYNHFDDKAAIVAAVVATAIVDEGRAVSALTAHLDDPAEVVAVAHRHFVRLAAQRHRSAWLLTRPDLGEVVLQATAGVQAAADLDAGIAAGRFEVPDRHTALHASGGALVGSMRVALGDEGRGPATAPIDEAHAAMVLQMLGLPAAEARAVASRPMPTQAAAGPD